MADHMIVKYRDKAEKWVQQAEKAQRRVYMDTITRFKFHDASCYLELAGLYFRVAKRFQDAGVAYKQCGRLEDTLKRPEVAASLYHDAALCFQKDDPQEAATCYLNSINLYCQTHRFSTAARLEMEVAELMEKDRNLPEAIVHYIKAADFYRANTCCDKAADRCLLKAAHALGLRERYVEAAALFQEVGRRILVDDLLKFNCPEIFLKAVLCIQCASGMPEAAAATRRKPVADAPLPRPTIDSIRATIMSLGKASSAVKGSREYAFASDVARAGKEGDLDLFAARVYAYNNVCRLGVWHLSVLKTIADHVEAKSTKLRKIRSAQDRLRRKQLAAERARECMKSRQGTSTNQGDSAEGTPSERTAESSSSEPTLQANAKARSSGSQGSSASLSSRSGSSSTGTESASFGSSSPGDVSSPSESDSEGSSSDSGSSSASDSGASRSSNTKGSHASRDRSGTGSSSLSIGSGSQSNSSGDVKTSTRSSKSQSHPVSGSGSGSESSPESSISAGSGDEGVSDSKSDETEKRDGAKGRANKTKGNGSVAASKGIKGKTGFWSRG